MCVGPVTVDDTARSPLSAGDRGSPRSNRVRGANAVVSPGCLSMQVVVVDLDANSVTFQVPILPLPKRERQDLLDHLATHVGTRLPNSGAVPSLFEAFPLGKCPPRT